MKKTLATAAAVVAVSLAVTPPAALARESAPYLGASVGIVLPQETTVEDTDLEIDFKNGIAAMLQLGYQSTDLFRVEGELGYRHIKTDTATSSLWGYIPLPMESNGSLLTVMVNGYLDFVNQSAFTPYVGAGAGIARYRIGEANIAGVPLGSETDTTFGYQFIVGAGIALSSRATLDLAYRFLGTEKFDMDGDEFPLKTNTFTIGLRTTF